MSLSRGNSNRLWAFIQITQPMSDIRIESFTSDAPSIALLMTPVMAHGGIQGRERPLTSGAAWFLPLVSIPWCPVMAQPLGACSVDISHVNCSCFPGGSVIKTLPANAGRHRRCRFNPWVRKIPWRKKWQPTPAFLPGKFNGQRSLAGYSTWPHKKLDMTEWPCSSYIM